MIRTTGGNYLINLENFGKFVYNTRIDVTTLSKDLQNEFRDIFKDDVSIRQSRKEIKITFRYGDDDNIITIGGYTFNGLVIFSNLFNTYQDQTTFYRLELDYDNETIKVQGHQF